MRGWKLFGTLYGSMVGVVLLTGVFAKYSPQGRRALSFVTLGNIAVAGVLLAAVVGGFVWINKLMDEEQARRGK